MLFINNTKATKVYHTITIDIKSYPMAPLSLGHSGNTFLFQS